MAEHVIAVWVVSQRFLTIYNDRKTGDKSKYPVVHFYSKLTVFTGLLSLATYQHGTYPHEIIDELGEVTGREEKPRFLGDDVDRFFKSDTLSQIHEAWEAVRNQVRA
jgi:hypothetical protein